uniref:Noc2p family, putative n=1 Tax=Theileria annulata TaxID=5874 RepID=A0A3B0MGE3_THEAN
MKRDRKKINKNKSQDENEADFIESESESELDSEDSEVEFVDEESESEQSHYDSEDDETNNVDFESEDSQPDFDEDTNLPVLTSKLSQKLLDKASSHSYNSIKKLLSVFSSVVGSVGSNKISLASDTKNHKIDVDKSKMKFKYLKNENKRILKGTASRFSEPSKVSKKDYVVKDWDVYKIFVSSTCDVMSDFLKDREVTGMKEEVTSSAPLVRKFLSTSLVQLAFILDDFELTRSCLVSLSSTHVMKWICVFKNLNNQFVKIVSSLMCAHPQKHTRIDCFCFLSEYLKCVKDHKLMRVQLSFKSYLVNYAKLSESESKSASNTSIDLLLKRCHSSHVKSVMNGITLKNYGLFKVSQNCISELYLNAPFDNLYLFSFKTISNLAYNVRREWNSSGKEKKPKKKEASSKEDKTKKPLNVNTTILSVCSWGFIESVNIWINVLSRSDNKMKTLIYPLVTVINSAIKIKISNKRQIPFVLHLLISLNKLLDGTHKFIPIMSLLFHVLDNIKNFKQTLKSKGSLEKSEDIMVKLRLSGKSVNSSQYVELILIDHLGILSLNPSFPEYTNCICYHLKRYIKSPEVLNDFRNTVNSLLKVLNETNVVVTKLREGMDDAALGGFNVFEPEKIPMYKYRQDFLVKFQQVNKDKFVSSLQINDL